VGAGAQAGIGAEASIDVQGISESSVPLFAMSGADFGEN
jgi:hypothetical protein